MNAFTQSSFEDALDDLIEEWIEDEDLDDMVSFLRVKADELETIKDKNASDS